MSIPQLNFGFDLPSINATFLIKMTLNIVTCSWNYDSWVGLVYNQPEPRSVEYLAAYAKHFKMVDVDS
jgi:hypothetical protein